MKGIVFNLLEAVVVADYGEETWDKLLEAADASGAYTSLGNYEDAEIEALAAAAATALGVQRNDVLRWFGRKAIAVLAGQYPDFFTPHRSARPFLNGVNDIIHAEVRKLYPGALCPHFGISIASQESLVMKYRSTRNMCALAEGFILGAADWYGETVEVTHNRCISHGDDHCELDIHWVETGARDRAA